METKPIIIEPDYWGVLVQWLVFFGFFAILILPAFLYKNLAKKFNKKVWLYFILGLIVGVIGLMVVHLFARCVQYFNPGDLSESARYFWLALMYFVGYLFVWFAYRMLLAFLSNRNSV